MAAPHVTGDAALILQRTPQATPAQVWQTMSGPSDTRCHLGMLRRPRPALGRARSAARRVDRCAVWCRPGFWTTAAGEPHGGWDLSGPGAPAGGIDPAAHRGGAGWGASRRRGRDVERDRGVARHRRPSDRVPVRVTAAGGLEPQLRRRPGGPQRGTGQDRDGRPGVPLHVRRDRHRRRRQRLRPGRRFAEQRGAGPAPGYAAGNPTVDGTARGLGRQPRIRPCSSR